MAGQGGLDADAMWAELKKADSSKIIDASHIPTSVLDGRWVTLSTNQTITGQKTFTQQLKSTVATGVSPFAVDSTTIVKNLNVNFLDGRRADSFTSIIGRHSIGTSGTAPYNYIHLFRIANSVSYSTLRVDIDIKTRYHRALLFIDISTDQHPYGESGTAINISKLQLNGQGARLYYTVTKQSSGYNYYDIYYNSGARNTGSYDVILRGINGGLVFEPKNTNMDNLPSGYVEVIKTPLDGDISGNAATATALKNSRTLWGQPFNGTANVSGDMTGVGSITMSGDLKIGNGTSPNTIYFYGTTGDSPGGYNHTFIAERLWGGTESSELVLFKGDDIGNGNEAVNVGGPGPDRIRHIAAAHLFQTYTSSLWGSVESVCTSSALKNLFSIASNRVTSYVPFRSTVASGVAPFIVASNTVVGNLNADLLDGLHEYSFLRYRDTYGIDGYNTLWAQIGIRQYNNAKPDGMANPIYNYGAVISLPGENARLDIWYNHMSSASDSPTNGIQYRSGWGTDKKPWRMLLDSVNYASYSDGRYVKKAGDTMTGNLAMDTNKGFYIPHGTRVVKTSGNWIHGGGDTTSSTDANLRFGSWNGIGWYPTISGQTVAQGKNAMWLNVRNGNLDTHGVIISHNGYLAANWDSARRLVLGGGDSYVWIDSRNSSNKVLCNIVLQDNKVVIGNYAESKRFVSTVGTGTQPYQCSSTTLNSNLNADMLDNWHLNFLPRNYNIGRCYAVRFALGLTDNGWKKIFACAESGAEPYKAVTVWGRIWYAYGNHAQEEVRYYHFCAIFQMRGGPSSSDSSVGTIKDSARLYLPTFAKGMDNIRLVRVSTNYFEIQVRQINSYHNANIEYQYWSNGCNVSAWENLQSTSNTSVAVSAGGASTLADSRASSADVWTTARTFYIQDYHSANTGAGVSVNGGSNCYLKLPSTTRFSRIDFSTPDANIRHSGNDNGNEVGSSTLSNLVIDSWYGVSFTTTCSSTYQNKIAMSVNCRTGRVTANNFHAATNITANGAITAKASSSDIRLKTDIQGYDAMGIIRKFRSVKYHWNAIAKENSEVFNHDNWNYGLIAQDLLSGGYTQWVKDIFNDYYTIDYERLIPVVWKGLQEVDDEVTRLKKRVKELENRLGINN